MGVRPMIGAFLSFLLSIWGVMTLLIGFVTFFVFPVIGLATPFKGFSRIFLKLAALPLNRAAIVVSEQNDLLFKQMSFQNLGLESITLDGDDKLFEDPDNALHHWLGIPFALADEASGVLFDPRHAALGMRKQYYDRRGENEFLATDHEWETWDVAKWVPGVFEMPTRHELVDLSAVRELIDGGERAEYPERGEEFYKHSRDPFSDKASITKFLYPIIGFSVPFFGIWIGVTQLGGPSETVQFGAVMWLLAGLSGIDLKEMLVNAVHTVRAWDWFKIISGFILLAIPTSVFGSIAYFISPTLAVVALLTYLIGLSIMPLITVIASPSALIGGALSKIYFKMGFMGFQKPVMKWTPQKYVIEEYDHLEKAERQNTEFYDLFGSVVGFTYAPDPSSWEAEYMDHQDVEVRQPVTDGGKKTSSDTNIPAQYVRSTMQRDGFYGGFLPKRVSDKHYYLHSGIALSRFVGSAIGDKTLRKLLEAKELHGAADDDIDEGLVLKATLVSGLFGALLGAGIFLIPPLL